jgi:hypothetical protein
MDFDRNLPEKSPRKNLTYVTVSNTNVTNSFFQALFQPPSYESSKTYVLMSNIAMQFFPT